MVERYEKYKAVVLTEAKVMEIINFPKYDPDKDLYANNVYSVLIRWMAPEFTVAELIKTTGWGTGDRMFSKRIYDYLDKH